MITLAIIDTQHPGEIIKEVSPRDIANAIWDVSKIRNAMFTMCEISDLCANAITHYINTMITESENPQSETNYAEPKINVVRIQGRNTSMITRQMNNGWYVTFEEETQYESSRIKDMDKLPGDIGVFIDDYENDEKELIFYCGPVIIGSCHTEKLHISDLYNVDIYLKDVFKEMADIGISENSHCLYVEKFVEAGMCSSNPTYEEAKLALITFLKSKGVIELK